MTAPRPLWFGTERAELFGMLHVPPTDQGPVGFSGRGIVIVPPFGIEANSAHRPLRHLAEHLVGRGHVVLRYDHRGTGDSDGWDTDPDLVQQWVDGVGTAAALIRQESGAAAITVIGLRLGATLAATWGATHPEERAALGVDQMVLWAPVASGRTYVRELKALARMHRAAGEQPSDGDDDPGIESIGFLLSAQTVSALGTLDLLGLDGPPAPLVLVAGRDDLQKDQPLVDALVAAGCDARLEVVPGYSDLRLDDPERGTVPDAAFATIASWIDATAGHATDRSSTATPTEIATPTSPVATTRSSSSTVVGDHLATDGPVRWSEGVTRGPVTERAMRIGPAGRIFAIESRPTTAPVGQPGMHVALLNTGSNPRTGPGRLHVSLARHLAAQGATVLRVDLSGIGDTPAAPGGDEVSPYQPQTVDDVIAVIDHLRRSPGSPSTLVGICSGAWAAYHALQRDAVPLPDHLVLLNQMIHDDASWAGDGETPAMAFKARHELSQAFRSFDKWKRLANGDLQVLPVVRRLGTWARLRSGAAVRGGLRGGRRGESLPPVALQLRRIAERGTTQLHVFDEPESGLAYLRLHAPSLLEGPGRPPGMEVVTMSGTGHTFGPRQAQADLARLLSARLLAAEAAPPRVPTGPTGTPDGAPAPSGGDRIASGA